MSNSEYLKELIFPSANKLSKAEVTRLSKYTEEEVIKIVKDNGKSIDNLCKNFTKDEYPIITICISVSI